MKSELLHFSSGPLRRQTSGIADIYEAIGGRKYFDHLVNKIQYLETWLSGRKRLTANEVGSKSSHGFESHRLRNTCLTGWLGNTA